MDIKLYYCAGAIETRPDGTQGVAEVVFKDESGKELKKLYGCVVQLPPLQDTSDRNLVGCDEEKLSKVKYVVLMPWFEDVRPEGTPVTIEVSIYRYNKIQPKTFTIAYDKAIVNQDENRSFFAVLPCDSDENQFPTKKDVKSFKSSSFLKKWSSRLLMCTNLNQILVDVAENLENTVKFKLTVLQKPNSSKKPLQEFYIESRTADDSSVPVVTVSEFDKLEECGVLLIQPDKQRPNQVVGFYKKEVSQLRIRTLWNADIAIDVEQTSGFASDPPATTTTTTTPGTAASNTSDGTTPTATTTTTVTAASMLSGTTPAATTTTTVTAASMLSGTTPAATTTTTVTTSPSTETFPDGAHFSVQEDETTSTSTVQSKPKVHRDRNPPAQDIPDDLRRLKLKDLPLSLKDKIKTKISKPNLKGWRNIGEYFGFDKDTIEQIETNCSYSGRQLPGHHLLEHLEAVRPDLTVEEFIIALKTIDRNDVVKLISDNYRQV